MLAEREQQAKILPELVTPKAWIEWATNKGYNIPSQFNELKATLSEIAHPQVNANNNEPTRRNRVYEEIAEIPNYKTIGKPAIRKILATYIGQEGSCIKSLSNDSISWIDWQGNKQITTNNSLGKWLTRQKKT